ncbi:MAG: hypothetical protein M3Q14_02120 [bacterium]|nr:hypothetical protein [bacterium]
MAHYVIYIPGLGDHHSYGQNIAIQLWRFYGIRPVYFPLIWNNKESFAVKLERLIKKVDKLKTLGSSVSLVGVSAGASAVINAYAASKSIDTVISISGKINHPETIGKSAFDTNPDFEESMAMLAISLAKIAPRERKKILSIHPVKDQTVPIKDTIIEHAVEKQLPGRSHASGIFFGIVFGGPVIARFVKQKGR